MSHPNVISVTGGKGGIGKTNVSINLAIALSKLKQRILLFDADLGLANVDILLGLKSHLSIADVLNEKASLNEILIPGPSNIKIIPAASGIEKLSTLSTQESHNLIRAFSSLNPIFDTMIVDTAAGISNQVLNFLSASQEVIVVVCNDPSSLTDAYALMKVMHKQYGVDRFHVLANRVNSKAEGQALFQKLHKTAERYLDTVLHYIGHLPYDEHLIQAMRAKRAVIDMFPHAPISIAFKGIAKGLLRWPAKTTPHNNISFFFENLFNTPQSQALEVV